MTRTLSKSQNGNLVPTVGTLINSLFHDNVQSIFSDSYRHDAHPSSGRIPVNIRETDKDYQIDVVAPGCRKEDFKINLNEKVLTVSFSPEQTDTSNKKVVWTRNEYALPLFNKSFMVNDSVDVNNISASYQDGILRISLAKNEPAKSSIKHIEIK